MDSVLGLLPPMLVGLYAVPLAVFLAVVLARGASGARRPVAEAVAAGLLAAALLPLADRTTQIPAGAAAWQHVLLFAAFPIGAAVPLGFAAAVFHGTRTRRRATQTAAAVATWVATVVVAPLVSLFVGCAAGLGCT